MRTGDTLVINLDKLEVDFITEFTGPQFPADKIFNYEYWRDHYLQVVAEDEMFDCWENKGVFEMREKFMLAVICSYTTDADIVRVLQRIPNQDEFQKILIVSEEEAKEYGEDQGLSIKQLSQKSIEYYKNYNVGK